jgi:hypothetical protein
MSRVLPLSLVVLLSGCDQLQEVLQELKVPKGELARVDLVQSPPVEDLALWGCFEAIGDGCSFFGAKPRKNDLQFSFDLVFDLSNPNESVPIPLVELLLGFTVFDGANLGSACLSFCDPADESCVATTNAEGACKVRGSDDIQSPEDLIPTVDELFGLAEDVIGDGDLDNDGWRTIPAGEVLEAHVQFDLGIDTMLGLADELLLDAADDLLAGNRVKIDVPFTAEGTMFFDVPELGRKGVGFGPFADTWVVQ